MPDATNVDRDESVAFPLTGLQSAMLFQSIASPLGGIDIVQVLCHFNESIRPELLKNSWILLVARHDALRLAFRWKEGSQPTQVVVSPFEVEIPHHDLSDLPPQEQRIRLQQFLECDRVQPFDLSAPPLFRLALFQLDTADFRLVWTFHHIILDGRSLSTLLKEALSEQLLSGRAMNPDDLPPAPRYRDFLQWIATRSNSGDEEFWRRYLAGLESATRLGFDRGTGRTLDVNSPATFRTTVRVLCRHLTESLRQRAAELDITLNTLMQAAWGLLLSRCSGQSRVHFGAIRTCRHQTVPGATDTAGMFTNTVLVPIDARGDQQVTDWLRTLRGNHLAVREFEHTPLHQIRGWVGLDPSVPLFESLLAFEPRDLQAELRAQGGVWQTRSFEVLQHTGLPLNLAVFDRDRMELRLRHNQDRFEDTSADRMLRQLETILEGLSRADVDMRVETLPILSEEERREQLYDFNDTLRDYPDGHCLHEQFLEQAKRTPEAIGLIDDSRSYSYCELERRSASLARRLQARGAGPGTSVGLWADRSAEGAIAVIAVLRAGAHYVPLPTAAPFERLASIIADSGVTLLVAADPPDWLVNLPGVEYVSVTLDDEEHLASNLDFPSADPDSLFCVIYTSGTTGVPKGARLVHRGFTNLLWHRTRGRFEPGDFALSPLTAPLYFDGSIVQLFSPLITGGTLLASGDVSELGKSPWYHQLTVLTGASSLIAELVWQYGPPRSARAIGLGAEPLPSGLLENLLRSPAFERLLTGYGVTECSCYSTDVVLYDRRLQAGQRTDVTSMAGSIGRPIANTWVYLLDHRMSLLPLGVPGELFLGGVGVARGYLNRPELTSERFLRDPFVDDPDALIYRTGDLARWRDDGTLEFLGRLDDQVNLRGFRVEPREIEVSLAGFEGVRQSLVMAREFAPGDTRLVAYVAADELDDQSIRSYLSKKLPEYMIPSAFVRMDSLPLTSHGKVDRRQLPDAIPSRPSSDSARAEE